MQPQYGQPGPGMQPQYGQPGPGMAPQYGQPGPGMAPQSYASGPAPGMAPISVQAPPPMAMGAPMSQQAPLQPIDFHAVEETDAVRFSWNIWPSSRLDATRIIVPFGAMYTPLKKIEGLPVLPYEPVVCKGPCRAVLNPFCRIDYRGKIWICPFCFQRNHFPPQYADISESNLPAELIPSYNTIEYALPRTPAGQPVFIFVVDTHLPDDDLQHLKDALTQVLTLLPQNALVGLITFGTTVQVHELGFTECSKAYVFRGTKEVTGQQVQELLGLGLVAGQRVPGSVAPGAVASGASRFIQEVSECEFALTSIFEELQRDPWPVQAEHRPLRATGVALSVAIGLLECTYPNHGGRVLMFLGGPATSGPGQIVASELSEALRSHHDIEKDSAKHFKKSLKFYQGLAKRAVANSHVVDVFACSMDQVGCAELKPCCESTGGFMVLAEGFNGPVFKESLRKVFGRDEQGNLHMAFNATLEVVTSREYKVCGAVGPCSSLGKKRGGDGDRARGHGGVEDRGAGPGDDGRRLLRDREPALDADPRRPAALPPVYHPVPALLRPAPPPRHHPRRELDGRVEPGGDRDGVRPGGGGGADGAHCGVQDGERGGVRHPALARPHAHPPGRQVRGLPEGRPPLLPPLLRLLDLPPVHVPPAPLPVPPGLQQLPRRDRLLPALAEPGERDELADHDPADAAGVLVQRAAGAGAAGRDLGGPRPHPPPRHLLLRDHLPRGDGRLVAQGRLPRRPQARELQGPPRGPQGGRQRDPEGALPVPAAGGVRPAHVAGALPDGEAEPVGDAQHERQHERRHRLRLHRRRLPPGLHGPPQEARRHRPELRGDPAPPRRGT